jgi:hypothetical protein
MSNVRLDWNFSFLAGYHADSQNQYCCNEYNVNLNMITNSTSGWDHDTAFERIKYYSTYVLSSCVFVDEQQTEAVERYTNAGMRVIALPQIPVDQIIGMMIHYKFNAMLEDRVTVVGTAINSRAGNGIVYLHDEEENAGPFTDDDWWDDPEPTYGRKEKTSIVDFSKKGAWETLNLLWNEQPAIIEIEQKEPSGNIVTFPTDDKE